MNTPVLTPPRRAKRKTPAPESGLVTLGGIGWEQFTRMQQIFGDRRYPKLTFLNGAMEIMAPPSGEHEDIKKTLALLLECYMRERGIRFYGAGSRRLQQTGIASGEPDESYCIGSYKEVPDLVIEVVIHSGTLDKLEIYKPHQVPEVWFWKGGRLTLFRFEAGEYHKGEHSLLLPGLDPRLLEAYVTQPDQYDAVQAFRARLAAADGTL
jgi:Uma2 family endonuclease